MDRIITATRKNDSGLIDIRGNEFVDLRSRPDFEGVLDYLQAKGYLNEHHFDDEIWYVALTDKGLTYFEDNRDASNERRWTRGLAVAALLISIGSLIVSVIALTKS